MPLKARYKRRIVWAIISIIGLLLLMIIVVPPLITLNTLKPKIETMIFQQTGITAKINGNINFSLIGGANIVAHNITIPNGVVSSCEFTFPVSGLFNVKKATISSNIIINDANIKVDKITPFKPRGNVIVNDSKIQFLNKQYDIIKANFISNNVQAIVRTDQHKYEIEYHNSNFVVLNKNNNLTIRGKLFTDGTAEAHISIVAENINRWFEFDKPRIEGTFPIEADVDWNGSYGLYFHNIQAQDITGDITLEENGNKVIKLQSKNAAVDFSFLLKEAEFFKNTQLNIDFYGDIKFANTSFKHLYMDVTGETTSVKINKIIADDLNINNGLIDVNGAHDINISLPENNTNTTCVFNGTPLDWTCSNLNYGNKIFGDIHVTQNDFQLNVHSKEILQDINTLVTTAKQFGSKGIINFDFENMIGVIYIDNNNSVKYTSVKNKNLTWMNVKLPFLPDFMKKELGDFQFDNGTMIFTPYTKTWYLKTSGDYFYIRGNNFKKWLSNIDLQSLQDLPYVISGNYSIGNISNLNLEIANHIFIGSANKDSITLKTELFNIDSFIDKTFRDKYEEASFFTQAPITLPFEADIKLSLLANTMIYHGKKYNNFVYNLKNNTQTFSITDANRGNLLSMITKSRTNYDINIKMNKFVIDEKLLSYDVPLNVSNSTITAEINLTTSGKIAHDIFENLKGTFDISFDGGILYGLGISNFYASANNINTLNAEYALATALEGGNTPIKKMRVIGTYDSGDIKTISPLTLSMKHTDAIGNLQIIDEKMFVKLNLTLRGTSAGPAPITLTIYPDGTRDYSLSEIMLSFDPEYMKIFTKTHNKF